jgi:hypothetical protein
MPTITFNPDYFLQLGMMPFPVMMLRLFLDGGWIPALIIMFQGFWLMWVQERQIRFGATIEWTMLAVDIPRNNEQTPKAVEQIFSHLSGAYSGFDTYEKYWEGRFNPSFSFELVSVDGYIQYYIRCPRKMRDLVESSIYAQYPEAEISETQDYTAALPTVQPDPEWDVFGTEFCLKKPGAYPIRTYEEFEHKAAEVMTFKDPVSAILESLAQLKPGEQMWVQWLLTPTDESWQKEGESVVDKILGKKKEHKKTVVDYALDIPSQIIAEATGIGATAAVEKKPETPKMMSLSPGERNVLEAVQKKLSKLGFQCKMRMIYAGKRNVFNKGRVAAFKGAMNQFTAVNMNGFKPYGPVTPKNTYFWQRWSENEKKTKIMRYYKGRSGKGGPKYPLNTEELATVYHFPMLTVKAPLVKKTEAKRAEPPSSLPTEDRYPRETRPVRPAPTLADEDADIDGDAPKNLPFA